MAADVSEGILLAGFKNCPSRQVFEKKTVETPKNCVSDHFRKIVNLNTNVLKPSLFS